MRLFETADEAIARFADTHAEVAAALAAGPPRVLERGLVNRTFMVGDGPDFALQSVAPSFDDAVFARINPVADALEAVGITAPRLIVTGDGALSLPGPGGRHWRLLRWVAGEVFEYPPSAQYVSAAAALLARFHDALWHSAAGDALPDTAFHDTDGYIDRLRRTISSADEEVTAIGLDIIAFWEDWRDETKATPARPGHGDLKLSNFIYRRHSPDAVGIVDFDTLGQYALNEEFGDAARSWCNRASENEPEAEFDIGAFAALAEGYLGASSTISRQERASLVHGAGRIAVELAARFCSDAVTRDYFAWDPALAPDARTHNVWRARGQLSLARQIAARRADLEGMLG